MIRERFQAKRQQKLEAQLDYDNAPERDLDTLRTDATEILGSRSGLFKDHSRRKTESIINRISNAEAKSGEKVLRERFLEYRHNRTTVKIDRLNSKIENSSNSFLSKQLNRQRRQTVDKLEMKNKIRARYMTKLETKRQDRPQELQKMIDEIVKKKVDAMYKRSLRKAMHAENIGSHNTVKRAEFLAKLTPEKKKEITREAILQIRKRNIESGRLDALYTVDGATDSVRKVDVYERVIE